MSYKCECCLKNFDQIVFGSGRFCTQHCARSYATKCNRSEISRKVSNTYKKNYPLGRKDSEETKEKRRVSLRQKLIENPRSRKSRVLRRAGNKCEICGITHWRDKVIELRLDHIDGNRKNNLASNLRCICLNCDSCLPTFCGANKKKPAEQLGDSLILKTLVENNFKLTATMRSLNLINTSYSRHYLRLVAERDGNFKIPIRVVETRKPRVWNSVSYQLKREILLSECNNTCQLCGLKTWLTNKIKLRFDHIDGNPKNNSKENCRMICGNCDSTLETYCYRNYKYRAGASCTGDSYKVAPLGA